MGDTTAGQRSSCDHLRFVNHITRYRNEGRPVFHAIFATRWRLADEHRDVTSAVYTVSPINATPRSSYRLRRRHDDRLPPDDGPGARPGPCVVGNAGEPAAQLDGSRQLASPIEGGPDGGSVGFRDNEHLLSMGETRQRGKRGLAVAMLASLRAA